MSGILCVDRVAVEATTGHILETCKSGSDAFRSHPPAHVALRFRQPVMQDAWQVCCAPNAEVIERKQRRTRKPKAMPE